MGLEEVTVEDSFWVPDAPRECKGCSARCGSAEVCRGLIFTGHIMMLDAPRRSALAPPWTLGIKSLLLEGGPGSSARCTRQFGATKFEFSVF